MSSSSRETLSSSEDNLSEKGGPGCESPARTCQTCGQTGAFYSCLECVDSFCETCVQKHSKVCAGLKSPQGLTTSSGNGVGARGTGVGEEAGDLEVCTIHGDKHLGMFCKQHDAFLCTTCVDTQHRSCKDVTSVSNLAQKVTKSKEYKAFNSDLSHIRGKLSRLRRDRKDDQKKLKQETDESMAALTSFRKDIDWVLDRLEKKGKGYIEKRHKEINKSIEEDIKACDDMLKDLDKLIKKMEAKEDKSGVFYGIKKGKNTVVMANKVCTEIKSGGDQSDMVKFTVDPKVKEFAMGLGWYGKDRTFLSFVAPVQLPHMYSIKQDSTFDMRARGDRLICSITSTCQLENGTLIVTDAANKKVKHVDITYKVADAVAVDGEPVACTTLSETSSAVSVSDVNRHYIQFVEIERFRIKKSGEFSIPSPCNGLAASRDRLILAFDNSIAEFTLQGERLRDIHRDEGFKIQTFTANRLGSRLFIANNDGRLLYLDSDGAILKDIQEDSVKDSRAMCVDRTDQLFVAGYDSHNVYMVSHEGTPMGLLLNGRAHRVKQPQMVWYDGFNSRLLLAVRGSNGIKVCDLK